MKTSASVYIVEMHKEMK